MENVHGMRVTVGMCATIIGVQTLLMLDAALKCCAVLSTMCCCTQTSNISTDGIASGNGR